MTCELRASGITVGYGGVPVVHGIDMHVDAGEVVVLLGANGAGKSTTLLAVAGELPLLAGELELFGTRAVGRLDRRARQGLAYLPEGRGVLRSLTVKENLQLGCGSVARALEIGPELARLAKRRGGLLSGGEQQILALSRALAAEPRLVLADELSLGLAPVIVERMLGAVRGAADRGAGVLLVEQHAAQALAIADRGYVLRRGEIVMEGSAAELLARIDEVGSAYLAAGAVPAP